LVPLKLIAGLVEGATPALAYNVGHGYAQHDMRLHEETLRTAHPLPPSRMTLERIAKRIIAHGLVTSHSPRTTEPRSGRTSGADFRTGDLGRPSGAKRTVNRARRTKG
jgi:hypothetical protein